MPAFDLSGMYGELARSIPGYESIAKGQLTANQVKNERLAYEAKKDELEAARGLRALFEQNPNAGIEEVARYSPTFAQDLMKSRLLMQKEMLGMKETEQKMEKGQKEMSNLDRQTVANTLAPIAEQALITGDMEAYKRAIGQAASALKAQGINLPMSFDPEQHTPEQVLRNATGFGYKSPLIEQQMKVSGEQQMRQLPPAMTSEQYHGSVVNTPYGPMYQPPLPNSPMNAPAGVAGGMQQRNMEQPNTEQPPVATMRPSQGPQQGEVLATAQDIPELKARLKATRDPQQRQMIWQTLTDLKKQTQGGAGFITPDQMMEKKAEEKALETTAAEKAKAETSRLEEGKRITDAFKRAMGPGGVSRVMKLISESTSGPTEAFAADIKGRIPVAGGATSTEGMSKIARLKTIAGEVRKTIERSPGPQSDKDVAIAALDAADIGNETRPYNERMDGFLEFTRIIKERAEDLGIDPKEIGIDVDTSGGTAPVKVKSFEEAKKLAPGTLFETPDGKIIRRD